MERGPVGSAPSPNEGCLLNEGKSSNEGLLMTLRIDLAKGGMKDATDDSNNRTASQLNLSIEMYVNTKTLYDGQHLPKMTTGVFSLPR